MGEHRGGRRGTNIRAGLLVLAAADVIRLSLPWQMDLNSCHVRALVEESRDPEGFTRLKELAGTERWASASGGRTRRALVRIMVAKGGGLADITVGDVLEYDTELRRTARSVSGTLYCAWLRELGHLPANAPTTLRFLERTTGQLTCAQLVDRHPVASGPIRALIVNYLEERRPRLDYSTLDNLARHLTRNFWVDIERHHPELDTLHLPANVAAAWKERLRTRIQRRRRPDGSIEETVVERADRVMIFIAVRAFYLDIARWAGEEPGRWGPWVAPCPIKVAETPDRKRLTRTKARMDQRTRERLPLGDVEGVLGIGLAASAGVQRSGPGRKGGGHVDHVLARRGQLLGERAAQAAGTLDRETTLGSLLALAHQLAEGPSIDDEPALGYLMACDVDSDGGVGRLVGIDADQDRRLLPSHSMRQEGKCGGHPDLKSPCHLHASAEPHRAGEPSVWARFNKSGAWSRSPVTVLSTRLTGACRPRPGQAARTDMTSMTHGGPRITDGVGAHSRPDSSCGADRLGRPAPRRPGVPRHDPRLPGPAGLDALARRARLGGGWRAPAPAAPSRPGCWPPPGSRSSTWTAPTARHGG
ncbi:hypothetical protein [Streptomyces sp. NPDC127118]|uniref:hypothetical protein n=1 Tax=Streptomyces sp. NPDC127118 TaxID=3345369 RepID=UPI00362D3DAC